MSPFVERFASEAVRSFEDVSRTRPNLRWVVEIHGAGVVTLRASVMVGDRILSVQRWCSRVEIEARATGPTAQEIVDVLLRDLDRRASE